VLFADRPAAPRPAVPSPVTPPLPPAGTRPGPGGYLAVQLP
jgi:hypothetical protein